MYAAPWFSLIVRSTEAFTSAEVIVRPVWNLTPERRWKVHILPSGVCDQLVASTGSSFWVWVL